MTAGASPPQSVSAGLVSARGFLLWRVAEGRAVIGGGGDAIVIVMSWRA